MINLLFILVVPSLIFFLFIFKQFINSSKFGAAPLPPGPYPWPIVGNLFQMGKYHHVTLANLAKVHGPLMLVRLGSTPVVVGSSPAAAAEILKTHDRLLSGRYVPNGIAVEGSKFHSLNLGFMEECDDRWKNIRGVYKSELFSVKAIESQVSLREEKVGEMVNFLCSKQGQVLKIKEIVHSTVLNILSNICLTTDLVDFEGKGLGEGLSGYIRGFAALGGTAVLHDFSPMSSGWAAKRFYKKFLDIFGRMCNSWDEIIKEKRKAREELFSAGTESTSATSEWALVELIKSPEAMKKLRNELAKVVDGDRIREAHLPRLPYLEACVKETLRLHPPGPLLLPHRAVETSEVMGYTITKGTLVMVNMWAIARDPKIWTDASSFKPERFLELDADYKGHDFMYIPFSSGRRLCPGQPLASKAVPLIVASLIHTFDWVLPNNMDPADIDMNDLVDITMLKENPLCISPILRSM
ncbi:hypothetical protein LguiB_029130 [Lonicera macranthoides]